MKSTVRQMIGFGEESMKTPDYLKQRVLRRIEKVKVVKHLVEHYTVVPSKIISSHLSLHKRGGEKHGKS